MTETRIRHGVVLPSRDDGFVAGQAELLGGPPGKHAALGRGWWSPLRIGLALLMMTMFTGWSYKAPCQGPSADWGKTAQFQYRHLCYSDIYPLYGAEGLEQGKVPYKDITHTDDDGTNHYLEYPVGIGAVMQISSWATHALPDTADNSVSFFNITALLLTLATIVGFVFFFRLTGRRPWDAALFAVAPALALHAFTNWDLVAVAWGIAGLWAWMRNRPALAGVLIGLGTATKVFPIFLLVAITIVAFRAPKEGWRAVAKAWAAAVIIWLVVNVPVALAWQPGWLEFFKLNNHRPADWDSVWFMFSADQATSPPMSWLHALSNNIPLLNEVTAALFIGVVVGIGWLVWAAPQRARIAQVAFLITASFLLINKVFSPQYTLWLLPLAILARPRWGLFLAWQLMEIVEWAARLSHFYDIDHPGHGAPQAGFFLAVVVRDLLIVAIMAFVVRDIGWPQYDVVRRDHDGRDPLAGAFDEGLAPVAV